MMQAGPRGAARQAAGVGGCAAAHEGWTHAATCCRSSGASPASAPRRDARCQPNFRRRVTPDPTQSCGPFQPDSSSPSSPVRSGGAASASAGSAAAEAHEQQRQGAQQQQQAWPSEHAHDTIALVAVAADGSVAAGASSNGATHKVPGRVGDAAVPGGGAYADSEVGGCGATGECCDDGWLCLGAP